MAIEQIIQNIKTRISTIESYHPEEYALNKGILFELKDLLSMIEKDKPSLPSNLDEAANKWGLENQEGFCTQSMKVAAFKAGAEWMAGQYKTLGKTEIYLEDDGDEEPYTQRWLDLDTTEFAVPEGFKPGDKVIVQIRKIEEGSK